MSKLRSLVAIAALSLSVSCATAGGGKGGAPNFTLNGVDGRPVSLSNQLGKKVVLINFWATWCGPCTHELPHLQALYDKFKGQGLEVMAVAMDGPETIANVAPFVRRQGLTFPVLLDEETRAVGLYNPQKAAPYNVFIDRSGKIVATHEGFANGDEKLIEELVEKLVRGEEIAPAANAEAAAEVSAQ